MCFDPFCRMNSAGDCGRCGARNSWQPVVPIIDGEDQRLSMTDGDKLRALANWFDARDNARGYMGPREVQADLRQMADRLDAID